MPLEVRMDDKGRITIPKEIRRKLGLRPGDRLLIKVHEGNIILMRPENPFKIIESILKDLTFTRELRSEEEKQALKELRIK